MGGGKNTRVLYDPIAGKVRSDGRLTTDAYRLDSGRYYRFRSKGLNAMPEYEGP